MYPGVLKPPVTIYNESFGESIESWTADMKHSAQSNLYSNWKRDFVIPALGIYCHPVPQLFSQFPDKTSFRISHYHFLQSHAQKNPHWKNLHPAICKRIFTQKHLVFFYFSLSSLAFSSHWSHAKIKEPCSILELNLLIKSAILIHSNLRACLDVSKLAIYLAEKQVEHFGQCTKWIPRFSRMLLSPPFSISILMLIAYLFTIFNFHSVLRLVLGLDKLIFINRVERTQFMYKWRFMHLGRVSPKLQLFRSSWTNSRQSELQAIWVDGNRASRI